MDKVDVLVVLDDAISDAREDFNPIVPALMQARDAVAELIAFAESVRSMTEHGGRIEGVRTKWFNEKATAALARVSPQEAR